MDNSLSKAEIERENKRLRPLVERFVEKSSKCLSILETEGVNIKLIEDLNAHVDYVELKWQQFPVLVMKIEKKIQYIEAIITDALDPEVKKELTTADLVVAVQAATSSAGDSLSRAQRSKMRLRLIAKLNRKWKL